MKRLMNRIAGAALLVLGFAAAGQPAWAAPPVEAFLYRTPGLVTVSPSGKYVAWITAKGDQSALVVAPFAGGQIGTLRSNSVGKTQVLDVAFKSDDIILLTVLQKDVRLSGVRFQNPEDAKIDRAIVLAVPWAGGTPVTLKPAMAQTVTVKQALYNDPDHVLLEGYEGKITESRVYIAASLYKVNIHTGESQIAEGAVAREIGTSRDHRFVATVGWEADTSGAAYIRYDLEPDRNIMNIMSRVEGGDWARIARFPLIEEAPQIQFLGRASATTAYGIDRAGQDKRSVWEYDLASGRPLRQILADAGGEANAIQIDLYSGALLGAQFYESGKIRTLYRAKGVASAQAALDQSFTDYPINAITAYSQDHGVYAVVAQGAAQPPVHMLFDARSMAAVAVSGVYPLDPGDMSPVSTITYPSSDGRRITAFVTVPRSGGKGAPVVVMPHGGPEANDDLAFDGWRQFLASRGYVVLQPQFRGSDGYGAAHEAAGHLTWNTLVQDDVRTGIEALRAQGIGDTSRLCIFGWSYGGYMALAGAAFSPDLYKCAISGAGLSDLEAMMRYQGQRYGQGGDHQRYWAARMGDEGQRAAASPARFASAVKIPVLLIHGENDDIVPIEQSEIMEKALTAAGKSVRFTRLPGTGHSPFHSGHEAEVLRAIEAFLAENLR